MSKELFFKIIALSLLLSACAQVLMPNGGEKDMVPPKVVRYMPDSAAIHFSTNKINLAFNEYIQLKDINSQLIVSPPLQQQPEIKILKNKILSLQFKESLKENTTYTINFGNAIADITEGNTLNNFKYVFSTGNYIDSFSVSGTVKYAHNLKPEKNVLVMLYSDLSDSAVFKKMPEYYTKTNGDGTYKITNIKQGKYKLIALKDENNNFFYNPLAEYIAFADTILNINSSVKHDLNLFKEKDERLHVKRKYTGYGCVTLVFNIPVSECKIVGYNKTNTGNFIAEFTQNKDTLTYWFPTFNDDSIQFYLDVNNKRLDTVNICGCTLKKKKIAGPDLLEISSNASQTKPFDLNKSFLLRFNHPVEKMDMDKIIAFEDSLKLPVLKYKKINTRTYEISFSENTTPPLKQHENKAYKLIIPKNALADIFGLTNDSVKINFKTQESKFYAQHKFKIRLPKANYVLQLLDDKENVKYTIVNPTSESSIDIKFLYPGNYTWQLIFDADADGKFTTGNYLTKQQPEKIIYYPEVIKLRSDWVTENEWIIK